VNKPKLRLGKIGFLPFFFSSTYVPKGECLVTCVPHGI
jgi:hypothetical protein